MVSERPISKLCLLSLERSQSDMSERIHVPRKWKRHFPPLSFPAEDNDDDDDVSEDCDGVPVRPDTDLHISP